MAMNFRMSAPPDTLARAAAAGGRGGRAQTSASAIMLSWANALGCDTSVPAHTVAQDHNEIECRTWRRCNRTVDTREILDCRAARMGHEYKLDITWPMVLDFFDQFR